MKTQSKFMAMVCFAGLCHGWADPIIHRQPQSQAVSLGSEAVFSIEAMGEDPTNLIPLFVNAMSKVEELLPQVNDGLAQINGGLTQAEAALAELNGAIAQLEAADPNSDQLPGLKAHQAAVLGQQQGLLDQQAELNGTKAQLVARQTELTGQLKMIRSYPANAENNFLLYQWVRIYMHDFPEDFLNNVVGDQHNFDNLIPLFPRGMPGGGTTINIPLFGQLIPVPIHNVDGAITNTLRIPATRASDSGLYWVMVDDVFGNQLASTIAWLTVSPVRESPTSISQSGNVLKIKFNSQSGGFIERSHNLVDWVTFINVPAGISEISVNINADDHEFFRLKEQN
jgi:hypothetical protein